MESRNGLIDELRQIVAQQVEQQAAQLKEQAVRIAQLELELAKAKKDSTTSSKPPSSDITKWSTIATCKKQNRNFFSFLLVSITAQLNHQLTPSLLHA